MFKDNVFHFIVNLHLEVQKIYSITPTKKRPLIAIKPPNQIPLQPTIPPLTYQPWPLPIKKSQPSERLVGFHRGEKRVLQRAGLDKAKPCSTPCRVQDFANIDKVIKMSDTRFARRKLFCQKRKDPTVDMWKSFLGRQKKDGKFNKHRSLYGNVKQWEYYIYVYTSNVIGSVASLGRSVGLS